jgi:lipoprotein-anchoring transpeptidase ErfK/SrfK
MQAQAGLGLRRAKLEEAQQKAAEATDRLISLFGETASAANRMLTLSDDPAIDGAAYDAAELLHKAQQFNPDFQIQQEKIQQEMVRLGYARNQRWLEVNLTKQTLLAVEGDKPVYATLVSTGAGGMATDTEKNPYVTPRGIYRIHTKHTASTMDSRVPEAAFELRDVPYIQYFKDGYALHAAYWHDQFGMPRSHGCINLAPKDAAHLFAFTKPELPPGWHGAMLPLRGTVVWVHH